MRHQDLTINHRLESWVFANSAARNAPGSYVAADVGRVAFTTDSADYWRLLSTTPTWKRLNGVYAAYQSPQPPPILTATTSTTGVMAGMGASVIPSVTGKVMAIITGTMVNTVAGKWPMIAMRWGTGAPPANGAAPVGTVIGAIEFLTGNTVNNATPFSIVGVVLNAALGVQLWFDLVQSSTAGGTTSLDYVAATIVELP
jgi:hypothetical protein